MAPLRQRLKRAAIVAVFTFGFTALAAVLSGPAPATIVPVIAVVGWFILTPAVAVFDLPVIDDESESTTRGTGGDEESPLETLQERYAAGEISEAEFDRKVQRLLETGADGTVPGRSPAGSASGGGFAGGTDGVANHVTGLEDLTDAENATVPDGDRATTDPGTGTGRDDDREAADSATETGRNDDRATTDPATETGTDR